MEQNNTNIKASTIMTIDNKKENQRILTDLPKSNPEEMAGNRDVLHTSMQRKTDRNEPMEREKTSPKKRHCVYGAIKDVEVGRVWKTRKECAADCVHKPTVAPVDGGKEGAYSVLLLGENEEDVDFGDSFTYTGGGEKDSKVAEHRVKNLHTTKQPKEESSEDNLSLCVNWKTRKPVRVVRGCEMKNEFAPKFGYRYDGLYTVEKYWKAKDKGGLLIDKFAFKRCEDQAPPPWKGKVSPKTEVAVEETQETNESNRFENNVETNNASDVTLKTSNNKPVSSLDTEELDFTLTSLNLKDNDSAVLSDESGASDVDDELWPSQPIPLPQVGEQGEAYDVKKGRWKEWTDEPEDSDEPWLGWKSVILSDVKVKLSNDYSSDEEEGFLGW